MSGLCLRGVKVKKKIVDIIFITMIMLPLMAGFITTLFGNKEINEYENRYAEKIEKFTLKGYADASFQDSVEKALADRVNFAEEMKKAYNDFSGIFMRRAMDLVQNGDSGETYSYTKIGNYNLVGEDYIVFSTSRFEYLEKPLRERIKLFNDLYKQYPHKNFYFYYIEKDTDINFENNEKVGVFEFMAENIEFPSENMGVFKINSFKDFSDYFYKTDHHWNEDGSYRGYCDLLELLHISDKPIEKGEKILVSESFSGSKAKGEASAYCEAFYGYKFNLPEMEITVNGKKAESYGNEEDCFNGEREKLSYGEFYGGDMGEVVFDTGNDEKENLLIIGESYDNAVLKLISTHFNRTYAVDMRYYKAYMGKNFKLGKYMSDNKIDKVLFMGNVDFVILDEFKVEQ